MHVLKVRNVHEALIEGLTLLRERGRPRQSRNGNVYQFDGPVATVYEKPDERVLFHPWRDANPFFHFYESLWMLAGRNDVASLTRFVKRMESFSDDGQVFNAAYGYRWRHATKLNIDQLKIIVAGLRANHDDRRQVLKIWAIKYDCGGTSKDVACNIAATFQISVDGAMDMVVFCRSNDIVWGAYGANAVHFSMLQEYVARAVGVPIGRYTQISVNFHAYEDIFEKMNAAENTCVDPYVSGQVASMPIMSVSQEEWDADVIEFTNHEGRAPTSNDFNDPFFKDVACPLVMAHDCYKDGDWQAAIDIASIIPASDWRRACVQWLERRRK